MGSMRQPFRAAQTFGQRVRDGRIARGWTQERLAEVTGLHATYVASVERGERNISLRNILRLAEGLDIGPEELVKGLNV